MNETFIRLIAAAHSFLAAISLTAMPHVLLRAHQHAKQLLPTLLVEYREANEEADKETSHNKFIRQQAESDPFLEDANLTRDAYSGRGDLEPDRLTLLDPWGYVRR